ncbi:Abi family protein [Planococcus donghaensis]|uniref:Abi family protein n=1 Tax=Planococcus donghaensis TaxID=414778 RepID=UPI003735CF73
MDASEPIRIKQAKTYEQQLDILRSRGIEVTDSQEAIAVLKRINYYRLTAYGLTFKDEQKNQYLPGTTFEQLIELYDFDKKLRQLLGGVIESIEIAFRTHIAYYHVHKYGPIGYKEAKNFNVDEYHEKFIASLDRFFDNSKTELFVSHHQSKYQGVFPFWVTVEVLSFSTLSMLFKNLKYKDKLAISKNYYKVHSKYVESWLHTLSTIRNTCAHHGRLYGKKLTIRPKLFDDMQGKIQNDEVFAAILTACKLLSTKERTVFINSLSLLIEEYRDYIDMQQIGFPRDWKSWL